MKVKLYDVSVIGRKVGITLEDKQNRLHCVDLTIYDNETQNGFAKKTLEVLGFQSGNLSSENLDKLESSPSESGLDYKSTYNLKADSLNKLSVIQRITD